MRSLTLTFLVFVYPLLISGTHYYCIYTCMHLSLLVEWQVHLDGNCFWQLSRYVAREKNYFTKCHWLWRVKSGTMDVYWSRRNVKKARDRLFISRRRPDRFHRSRHSKPITSRLDLQIRSGISILSALQIDNTREERCAARQRKRKKHLCDPMTPSGY